MKQHFFKNHWRLLERLGERPVGGDDGVGHDRAHLFGLGVELLRKRMGIKIEHSYGGPVGLEPPFPVGSGDRSMPSPLGHGAFMPEVCTYVTL